MLHRARARKWLSRGALIIAGVALLILMVLLALHTASARDFVLRRAVLVLADRFDLVLDGENLQYNLVTRRLSLSQVRLSATHAPRDPFLTADRIEVAVPPAAFFGTVALDRVRLENARFAIHRRADGSSNLPSSESSGDEEPSAILIGRLEIPQLGVALTDESSGLSLSLPHIAVDVGPGTGQLRLVDSGRLSRGSQTTTVKALGGGVAFDGRVLRLSRFTASTDETDVALDGRIALLVSSPNVEMQVSGTGDVAQLARWATREAAPAGTLAFDATIDGPLASPAIDGRLRSDALSYQSITVSRIAADLKLDSSRLETTRLEMALAEGRVTAAGQLTFDSSAAHLSASWSDLSVELLGRMITGRRRSLMPAGRASGKVSFAGNASDMATWTLEVSNRIVGATASPGDLPVTGEASFNVDDGRWRLDGTHVVADAGIDMALRGDVVPNDLTRSSLTGTIEALGTDVSRVMTTLGVAGVLDPATQTVVSGRLDVMASLSGTVAKPAFEARASGQGLSTFDVRDISINATATGDLERAVVEAKIEQRSVNVVEITGTVWPNEARLDAGATGRVSDWSALGLTVPVAGTADVRLDARGPFQAIVGRGSVSVADARYNDVALGPLDAQVVLDAGVARVTSSAPDFGAMAQADLRMAGSQPAVVDLQVLNAPVERLLQVGGVASDISGNLSFTAHAEGVLDDWRHGVAAIEVGAFDGRSEALAIRLQETARIRYDRGTLDVLSFEAAVGETRLSVGGRYALLDDAAVVAASDALRGLLVGDLSHVVDAVRASGFADAVDVNGKGPVVVLTRVNGRGQQPLVTADLEFGPGEVIPQGLPPVRRMQVRARVAEGWAEVASASGDWQEAAVTLQGRVPLRLLGERIPDGLFASATTVTGPASLDLRAVSVTAQALSPFLPPESIAQIEGALDATVHLEAPSLDWSSLQGEARLDRFDVAVAGVALAQQEPTRIVIEKGIARPASWNWSGRGTSLVVQGEVRLPEQRAAVLAGGQIDLRLLTPFLAGADIAIGGSARPRVSVSGPLDDLRIEGDVTVADGELRMRDPDVIVTGLSVMAALGRDRARITSADGQINGGSLTGTGDLIYGGQNGLAGSIETTIAGMGLEFPEGLRSELDAGLTLEVRSENEGLAGTLSGTVTVLRSAYREPIAVVTQLLSALRAERLAAAATTERTFADRLQLNVRVLTDSDVIVDNNLARLQLGGDLRVIGTAGTPALSGRATLREGGELFLGRNRYTIDSGSIDFANPVTIEPNLNVLAQTRAGGEDIELTLKGTPETMSVELRSPSDPQLGQADIASLLLTGRSLNEVSGAEAEIVGEQLLSYLSGDVLGAAGRVVGLDTIRLGGADPTLRRGDAAEIASQTDPTSRLTFGKSIGESFDVTLSQSLREGGAQTWIVDYSPISRLDLRYVTNDENLRSYQFRHDVTVGDAGRRPRATPRAAREARRVTAVGLVGELGGPEERLRRVISVEPGDEFDFSAWQRDRDRIERVLHDEGRMEARVSARRQDSADGVAITYQIDAGPLTSIRFTGYNPSEETLRAIETAWSHSIFDDALVTEVKGLVGRALAERGYVEPSVMATMTANGTKTLEVMVEPGQRAVERRLLVDADNETLAREIEQWARRSGVEDQAWRDPATFQRALVEELRRRGHVSPDVTIAPPRSDGAVATVRVDVRAGPVVTIRAVSVTGAEDVASERLQAAAGIEPGAPYDASAVDRARERVARVMRGEGFADTRVEVNVEADPNGGQVSVGFVIDKGPRQVLREIVVSGNRSIERDVIVRTLALEAGDPLGTDAWLRARSRLFDTALFRRVDVTAEPLPMASGERPMRLVVTVEEWPALRVRYGLQVSEERPAGEVEGRDLTPGFSADVTRRTLFGRAITVGGAVEYQRRERLARGFLNSPTMFGLPVESLLSVEQSHEEISEASIVTDRRGISWEQRVRIGRPLRLSYGYTYDRDHTFSTRVSDDPFNPTFDVTINIARLASSAVFDSRDNPLDTTRGWLVSSNLEYAPASLGSDIRFVRYLAQAYYFQPMRRLVLASAARLGLATALDGQLLIPSERFFAGGARTVRGVPENTLGPRDIFGDAAGGGALVVFNQEVRFPLYRWFGGIGFVDLGNVFEAPRTIDFADLVGSFGAGLRVATPFALLRADVARLWSPEAGQPTARWTFGIGHTF
jgi:outer membrane protein assembly factor BamA/autotransporter translocation and assembly factor TamB